MDLASYICQRPFTLLVSLPDNDPELARAALEAGAEALKVHINVHHRASGTQFGSLDQEWERLEAILAVARGRPVGLVAGGHPQVRAAEVAAAVQMGFTTISMYAHHLPAAWKAIPGARFMVAPDHTYTDAEIAALGRLGADLIEASIIPPDGYGQPLTYRDLAAYQRIVAAVPQPVVIPSQRYLVPEDVPALVGTGARALMLGAVVTGRTPDGVYRATAAFRKAVDAACSGGSSSR
ncbi:MAG: hypothetical protein DIU70_008705 [Bacillota bacterium]